MATTKRSSEITEPDEITFIHRRSKSKIQPTDDVYFSPREYITDLKGKVIISLKEPALKSKYTDLLLPSFIEFSKSPNTLSSKENTVFTGKIYVFTLIDEIIEDKILEDPTPFFDKSIYTKLYKIYNNVYTDLQKNDLELLLESMIYLKYSDLFKDFESSYINLKKKSKDLKAILLNKYKLVKPDIPVSILKKITGQEKSSEYRYSLLASILFVSLGDTRLDTDKIIKEFKMSENLPLVFTFDETTGKPILKIFKGLAVKYYREWVLDKSKIKRLKGITFKIKVSEDQYINVVLSKTQPRLTVFFNKTIQDLAKFSDLSDYIKLLKNFIDQIMTVSGVPKIKNLDFKVKYSRTYFDLVPKLKISDLVKPLQVSKNLELSQDSDKSKLKLHYKPRNINVTVRNLKNLQLTFQVTGAKTENDITDVILEMVNLVLLTKKVNLSEENLGDTRKIQKRTKSSQKINTLGCQAPRKPRILKETESPNTYAVSNNGYNVTCNDKPGFPYPGYTVKNGVCCFSKDQRNKEVFKRNTKESSDTRKKSVILYTDQSILDKPLLVTNKILEKNRLGVLPEFIESYFPDTFARLGTTEILKNSFFEAISVCSGKKFSREKIIAKLDNNLFEILEDGSISDKYKTLQNYIKYLKTSDTYDGLIDLVEQIVQKNIIVITSSGNISCSSYKDFGFLEYILLYKNKNNFEPIVRIVDYKTIKRSFIGNEIKKFLDIYNKNCQINYISRYIEPVSVNKIKQLGIKIESQILDEYSKVIYIFTDFGLLPVISQTKLYKVRETNITDCLLDPKQQFALLEKLNLEQLKVTKQILDKNDNTVALVTSSGLLVPVKPGNTALKQIPIEESIQYIEAPIFQEKNKNTASKDEITKLSFDLEFYQRLRFTLAKILIYKKVAQQLLAIKRSTNFTFEEKLKNVMEKVKETLEDQIHLTKETNNSKVSEIPSTRKVCKELINSCQEDPYCTNETNICLLKVKASHYPNLLRKLSLEILNSNEILGNLIKGEQTGKGNFIKRENEIVLLSKEEIIEYLKN
jgi:hypothetical protein